MPYHGLARLRLTNAVAPGTIDKGKNSLCHIIFAIVYTRLRQPVGKDTLSAEQGPVEGSGGSNTVSCETLPFKADYIDTRQSGPISNGYGEGDHVAVNRRL